MERNDEYYSNNYQQHYSNENNPSQFSQRYTQRGNYYGMPDNQREYGNVRIQQRHDFNDFSEGPVGGYGAGNYNENYERVHRNRDDHYRYGDDPHFKQSHGYTGQSDYRSNDYRSQDYKNRDRDNQNYSRGQQYSSNYDVAGNRRYARQENSYENPGHGRRYSEYGRDERRNYGHELTDIHHDRGEFDHSRHDNNYGRNYRPSNQFDFDENKEDYRYSGRIESTGSNRNENRENMSRGPRPSGPDYSKWSPLGSYGYETFGI
ncbi:hypothetical protein H8S95_00585 [Pontibacter sp. KCTC 32443]|uniref:hypothetical protein n=1 Tax=Pontibacter TaxID=323449 RepID=UPI00164D2E67|nr:MULTISPECIES: hypothetical protein [Pontibacter]MBC5772545.1 hypothetical protein [Pontibacter sp. KCTC 32443]